jgi:hypothetical protein
MSKLESPMTRWYWHTVSGLLLEEFCLVNQTATCGGRWVDALVLPERDTRIAGRSETIDIAPGERAILVQTKVSRLGMYLMGQTLFSAELLRRRYPGALIESVALCSKDDAVLRPLLEAHTGCRVVVVPRSVLAAAESPLQVG